MMIACFFLIKEAIYTEEEFIEAFGYLDKSLNIFFHEGVCTIITLK
ncbi:MAG: hypothetical protein K0R51_2622 [Cytophagaceae bacterium]|jgi:hypothetical protein|nr:hypothetical protein [Cytophagaceae bacterium]